jgi:hypothetical protein
MPAKLWIKPPTALLLERELSGGIEIGPIVPCLKEGRKSKQ